MSEKNRILYNAAMTALNNLFSDQSVDPQTTRENLEAIIEELQVWVESLPSAD